MPDDPATGVRSISQDYMHSRSGQPRPKERITVNSAIHDRIVEERLLHSTEPDTNLFPGDISEDTQLIGWAGIAKRVTALTLLLVLACVGITVHTQYLEMQTERLITASNELRL